MRILGGPEQLALYLPGNVHPLPLFHFFATTDHRQRPTGLARDGSPATVFGGRMGTSPPMSARRNANNTLSTLSRLNDSNDNKDGATNNRVRPPLFVPLVWTAGAEKKAMRQEKKNNMMTKF